MRRLLPSGFVRTLCFALAILACDSPDAPIRQQGGRQPLKPRTRAGLLVPGSSTALTSSIGAYASFTFQDVPGMNRPFGVNDAGVIVGDYGGNNIAAVWSPVTGFHSVGRLDGTTDCCSSFTAINGSGTVAGWSHTAQGVTATQWTESGPTYVDLNLPGRMYSQAINDAGDIVGLDATGNTSGWFRSHSGAYSLLPRGPYSLSMETRGINAGGVIIGNAYVADDQPRAIAWPAFDAAPVELQTLSGSRAFSWAVNGAGDIVGWSDVNPASSEHHATLWPASGGVIDLSTWANGCAGVSEARAITADGIIAGRCNGMPVIWTAREGQQSLPLPTGVSSAEPTAISDGHIVGIINGFGALQWTFTRGLTVGPSAALSSSLGGGTTIALEPGGVPNMDRPFGVNDAGLVVGDYGGNNIAAVWSASTGFHSIGRLDNGSTDCCSSLAAVNAAGQAAGFSHSADGNSVLATTWSSNGTYSSLNVSGRPYAEAINDLGDIVGVDYTGASTSWYKSHSGLFALLPRGAYQYSMEARGMNSSGRIVGDVYVADNQPRAIAWPAYNALPVALPSLGGNRSTAWAVNTAGDIVGWSEISTTSSTRHATLWPASGGIVDLSSWASGCPGESEARAITTAGVIIGRCNGMPVVWTAVEGQRSLPVPAGTSSAEPTAISTSQIVGIQNGFGSIRWSILTGPDATPSGSNVSVQPTDATTGQPSAVSLTFGTVTSGGSTTVESATIGSGSQSPPPPPQFRLGSPPTYYDISTTATFSGSITICISYANVSYGNPSRLKLLHYNSSTAQWDDITTALNTETQVICGSTASLSPFVVAESNAAPVVTAIALPNTPLAISQIAQIGASFTDANPLDAHTAIIDWDGATSAGTVAAEPTASSPGAITANHAYSAPGVYTVRVTANDGSLTGTRSSASDVPSYVVVYDPNGAFVTGGGWINSQAGDCTLTAACQAASGKATFGLVSKYAKGATVPSGETEFEFNVGGLTFVATSYSWLTVSGSLAQYKGAGTVNGVPGYNFLVTAIDGDASGGGGVDKFRIKIWNSSSVIYDNQRGATDDSNAATALGGGSIVIHK